MFCTSRKNSLINLTDSWNCLLWGHLCWWPLQPPPAIKCSASACTYTSLRRQFKFNPDLLLEVCFAGRRRFLHAYLYSQSERVASPTMLSRVPWDYGLLKGNWWSLVGDRQERRDYQRVLLSKADLNIAYLHSTPNRNWFAHQASCPNWSNFDFS